LRPFTRQFIYHHSCSSRDGKNISAQEVTRGLKECYGLSSPLAYFLAYVGFIVIRKFGRVNLFEISKHDAVEHDASLVHHDTPEGEKFAPTEIDPKLVEALCADVKPTAKECERKGAPWLMNYEDVARARVRREGECRRLNGVHAEIARGEMAIILGVWETKTETKVGIPMEYFKPWISEERLPDGWKPDHVQGFLDVVKRSKTIKEAAAKLREGEAEETAGKGTSSGN
jgi:hypothetical protein